MTLPAEHLRRPERPDAHHQGTDDTARAETSIAVVEDMFRERRAMLASLRDDLPPTLSRALTAKIEHERDAFMALVEARTTERDTRAERDRVLPAAHFTRAPLETDLF